ncbi:hypothetical protein QQ045_031710 [Rhodiola kirilowii]
MATGEPIHKLVICFKGNQYTINNVCSDRYTHMTMLFDVSELAFKDVPSQLDMYITLNLPIPDTCQTLELRTDVDMKRMFQLYQKIENIRVLLKVSQNPPLVAVPPQSEKSVNNQDLEFAKPGRNLNWISFEDFKRKEEKVRWLFGADLNVNRDFDVNLKCLPSLIRGHVVPLPPNVAEAEPLPEVHLQPLEPLQQLEPQPQEVNSEEDDSARDSKWAAF